MIHSSIIAGGADRGRAGSVRLLRLATLTTGMFCRAGPARSTGLRAILVAAAVALVGLTFGLDRGARSNLLPPGALSISVPIGLPL